MLQLKSAIGSCAIVYMLQHVLIGSLLCAFGAFEDELIEDLLDDSMHVEERLFAVAFGALPLLIISNGELRAVEAVGLLALRTLLGLENH
jgi:hypothetical protein